ncbi:MAG: glycosyltransferase [Rubrivivax sp.]|nr:glycosyltransferase [Rubrivivax sp.]
MKSSSTRNGIAPFWFGLAARLEATLRACDAAIATTPFLADRVRDASGKPTAVLPNFMNQEQLAVSDVVWAEKTGSGFARDGSITLAYFSGSPHHGLDFAIVEQELEALVERRPEIQVMTVGYLEPRRDWSRFGPRVMRAPLHDWVNLQRLIGQAEVNLMPLLPSVFADCKSPLKFSEAAAVGTLSVASPPANYADCITDARNGYLAHGHEWQRQIERLLDSMEQYPALAARARDDALARFSGAVQPPALLQALGWN